MLPKRVYIITGTAFILIGAVILSNSFQGLTGFVIIEKADINLGYFIGIWFILGGILILRGGKGQKPGGLEIFISNKALEKSKKDPTVRENIGRYKNEIRMIVANPTARPQEIIGEFHVSPKLNTKYRVAWHYDRKENRLYIDDLLYHINDTDYDGRWNRKASSKKITKKNYEASGYKSAESL